MADITQALQFARQNPDSDFATEFRRRIEIGQINPDELQQTGIKKPTSTKGLLPQFRKPSGLRQFGIGAVKGAATTLQNIGQAALATPALFPGGKTFGERREEIKAETGFKPETLQPKGLAQKIGFGAEQIAEFFAPTGVVLKATKGLGLLGRAGIEAATFGGITAAQEGELNNEVRNAAIIGAAFPFGGAILKGGKTLFGKGLTKTGQKIQQTVIKPSVKDVKDGFKLDTLKDNKISGSLNQMFAQTHSKLNKLSATLKSKIKAGEGQIDLKLILDKTIEKLGVKKPKFFGDLKSIDRTKDALKEEIIEIGGKVDKQGNLQSAVIDLVTAQQVKQGAGTKGAWVFGMVDKDSRATEKVYSAFYNVLKEEIEKVAPAGLKDVNKQISDLIPVSNAILRRMPVADRNQILSLTDSIGLFASAFNPSVLALVGAKKLSASGRFAGLLIKAGEFLKGVQTPQSQIGKRIFGSGGTEKVIPNISKKPIAPKFGLSIKDVSKKDISKPLQPLAQKVRKFDTVEEFVEGQTKLFHGSNQPITEFKSGSRLRTELGDEFIPSNIGSQSDFVFFTEESGQAGHFAQARTFKVEGVTGKPTVTEGFVQGKILDLNKFPLDVTPQEAKLFNKIADELERTSTLFVDGKTRASGIGGADGRIIGELRISAKRAGKGDPRRISINFNDLDQSRAFAQVLENNNISGFKFGDKDTAGRLIDAFAIVPSKVKTKSQLTDFFNQAKGVEKPSVPAVVKELEPLAQQIKEFKGSAEEFVAKQEPIFHGTDKKFDKFDLSKTADGSVWFTTSKKAIQEGKVTAQGQGVIVERFIKPDAKFADQTLSDKFFTDELIQQGFEGIKLTGDKEFGTFFKVFDPEKTLLTKSQLTEIFNQVKSK